MTACPQCAKDFEPRRPDQRYCSKSCRQAHYEAIKGDGALRGKLTSVRVLSRGYTSINVRFELCDRDNALQLQPGMVVEVRK